MIRDSFKNKWLRFYINLSKDKKNITPIRVRVLNIVSSHLLFNFSLKNNNKKNSSSIYFYSYFLKFINAKTVHLNPNSSKLIQNKIINRSFFLIKKYEFRDLLVVLMTRTHHYFVFIYTGSSRLSHQLLCF